MRFFRHIIGGEIGEGETMEKFFHSDVGDVDAFEEFLRSDWQLFDCRVDGSFSQAIATNAIQPYCQKTQNLWGSYPRNYILAVRDKAPAGMSLAAIMEKLDHSDEDEIIALVGYNDGGLISLSSKCGRHKKGQNPPIGGPGSLPVSAGAAAQRSLTASMWEVGTAYRHKCNLGLRRLAVGHSGSDVQKQGLSRNLSGALTPVF